MFKSRTISAGNLDTAPFSAVSMQGKLSYNGHTLSLSGYKRSQVSRLRRGDYLLANGELIKLRDIVKQMTSQVIILAYYPSYTPSTNFTNEDFKWSRGSGWGDYPKEWHLFGDDFEVDGRAYTEGVNYTDLTDQVVLVQANDDVRVAVGNIAKEGNGVGGDGIEDVMAGANVSIDKSNPKKPTISAILQGIKNVTENTEWNFGDKSFKMTSGENTELIFNSEETLSQLFPEIKVTGFSSRTDIDGKEMLTFTGLGKVEALGQDIYTPVSALHYGDGWKGLDILVDVYDLLEQNDFQPVEIEQGVDVPFLIDDIGTLIADTITYDDDRKTDYININIIEADNGFDVYFHRNVVAFSSEEEQFLDEKQLFVLNFTSPNSGKQTVSIKRIQSTEYNDDGLSLLFVDNEQDKSKSYLFGLDGLQIDEKFVEAPSNYLDLKDLEVIDNPNIYQPDYEKSDKFYFDVNGLTSTIAAPNNFQNGEQLRIDIYNTDSNTVMVQFDSSYQVDHYTGETFGYGGSNFTMNVAENEEYQLYVTKSQSGKLLLQVIKYPDN